MRNLTRTVAEHANGTLWAAENLLHGAEASVLNLGHPPGPADAARLHAELRAMQRQQGYSHATFVVDRAGQILTVSDRELAAPVDVADREYFRFHLARSESAMYIDAPVVSRSVGIWSITLTRGVYDAEHHLIGVVGASLRVPYFIDFYASLDLGPGSSVVLARWDGQVLARFPFSESVLRRRLGRVAEEWPGMGEKIVTLTGVSPLDGIDRVVLMRKLQDYPIVSLITIPPERVFERWRATLVWHIVLLLAGTMAALLAGWVLWRQLTAIEQRTEQALHDELTGLPNRRAFDLHLEQEARRALRTGRPLALLMIDIDHFKRYNDVKGHGVGDECLRAVASALVERIKRPGDMVARWGGEEFCCIFPDTDDAGALQMADMMLEAVRQRNLPHPDAACVTISIGCASACLEALSAVEGIQTRADAALYEAKRSGRNRRALAGATA